eukprot:531983-Rhodomonas_salina.1
MEPASGHQSAETDYHLQSSHSVNFTLSFVLSSESKMTMESKQKQAPEWFSSPLLFSLACKQDETFQKKWGNSCVVNSNRAKYDEKMVSVFIAGRVDGGGRPRHHGCPCDELFKAGEYFNASKSDKSNGKETPPTGIVVCAIANVVRNILRVKYRDSGFSRKQREDWKGTAL